MLSAHGDRRLSPLPFAHVGYMTRPWDEISKMLPSKSTHYLANSITTFVSDRAFAERVAEFHLGHPVDSGQRQVEQSVERMLVGVAFAERVRPVLARQLTP